MLPGFARRRTFGAARTSSRCTNGGARSLGRLMTVFILPARARTTRLGIAATRKLGGAVVRNRAKRLVREIFRRHRHPPGSTSSSFRARALLEAPFQDIETEYAACVDRRAAQSRGPR